MAADVSGSLPRSVAAAVAWLHQQGPTEEMQLAALNARLQDGYDERPWCRPREARAWARALDVRPSCVGLVDARQTLRLSNHNQLRPLLLAAAARALRGADWSADPELARALAAGLLQLQRDAPPAGYAPERFEGDAGGVA